MKCQNCGTEFDGIFCPECGTKCISEDNSNELSLAEKKKQALEMEMRKKESEAKILAERRQQQADIESRKRQEEIELSKQKTEQERLAAEKAKYEAELARQKAEQEKAVYMQEQQKRMQEQERKNEALAAEKRKKKEALAAEKKIANEGKNWAVLSLVFGVLALITGGGLIVPEILGIVFAKKGNKDGKMRKEAKAGFICSLISIAVAVLCIIIALILS